MAPDPLLRRCRGWYAMLLRLYPSRFRERFGEGMEQTFADLLRERRKTGRRSLVFVLLTFGETLVSIVMQHISSIWRTVMAQDSLRVLKTVRLGALAVGALMLAGIVTLMFLARGTDEDITGIVAPALLVTIVSGIVAIAASVLQRRRA